MREELEPFLREMFGGNRGSLVMVQVPAVIWSQFAD
jgi:hypothetical protein